MTGSSIAAFDSAWQKHKREKKSANSKTRGPRAGGEAEGAKVNGNGGLDLVSVGEGAVHLVVLVLIVEADSGRHAKTERCHAEVWPRVNALP